MDAGNGWRFSTFTAESRRLFLADQSRHGGRGPSRRQRLGAFALVVVVLVGWGLWELIVG